MDLNMWSEYWKTHRAVVQNLTMGGRLHLVELGDVVEDGEEYNG